MKVVADSYLSAKEQEQIRESQKGELYAAAKLGIRKGMLCGIIMMAIAAIIFITGSLIGRIFIFASILFLIGVYAFLKGLHAGNFGGNR